MAEGQAVQIAELLVRRGDDMLLVKQWKPGDPEPYWTLPGGLLEVGESLGEAAVRETFEEAVISARGSVRLVYVSQHESPGRGGSLLVSCFETSDWDGDVTCNDPDGVVFEASFFSAPEAVAAIESTTWSRMRGLRMCEPLVSYLSGEAERGMLWLYRERSDGTDELVARVSCNG